MIKLNNIPVSINHFPDQTLLLKDIELGSNIYWKFENNEELVVLQFLVYHLRDMGIEDLTLEMPYIPNARQDRVKTNSDVFTLKHFSEIINHLHFKKVKVLDAHSPVSLKLIHNCEEMDVAYFMNEAIKQSGIDKKRDIVFFPDEGAKDRYAGLIDFPHVFGKKTRRWEDGQIEALEIVGDVPAESFNVLIIDDICSYGGTIKRAAEKLKVQGAKDIFVYISHCENSITKGDLLKEDMLTRVYTTNSLITEQHAKITILADKK